MNLELRYNKLITGIHGNPYLSTVRVLTKAVVLNLLENQLISFKMQFMVSGLTFRSLNPF